jgi:myo-inositol-1(or 4)-monophosphatase
MERAAKIKADKTRAAKSGAGKGDKSKAVVAKKAKAPVAKAKPVSKTVAAKSKVTPAKAVAKPKPAAPKKVVAKAAIAAKAAKPVAAPPKKSAVKATPVKAAPAKVVPVAAKPPVKAKPVAPAKPVVQAKPAPAAPPKAKAVSAPVPAPAPKPTVPPLPAKFLADLALAIKEAVEPSARAIKGREIVDTAVSGDVTFQLDRIAEKALLIFLKRAGQPVAYYSEDSGYTTFTSDKPKHLLVVDPIDGSRSAKSGFEGCVVSVASTRVIERPTMADVDNACVLEILGDRMFSAERGKGVRVTALGQSRKVKLSANANLDTLTWSMTVPARPAELIFPTTARLIDVSSLKGGFFSCNSTAFSMTRLLTDQLDACVDVANRYFRDIPDRVRDMFQRAGAGRVIGIAPYDLAAALLIAQEAGCVVTDAYGKSFDSVLLLDSSETNHLSLVAAANKELHEKLIEFLGRRIVQIEERLSRKV